MFTCFIRTMIINKTDYTNNFNGRVNVKRTLPKVRKAFDDTFKDLRSPSKAKFMDEKDVLVKFGDIAELNRRLDFVRKFVGSLSLEGGLPEYFRGLVGCVKAFKVANCDEYAEITKTICRMNGIRKCDMYSLFARKLNSKEAPRSLDHAIVAINVSKNRNNKFIRKPFITDKNTMIVDFWSDGFIGNVSSAKNKYKKLGLMEDEELLLKPLKSYEPNKDAFAKIKKEFPKLYLKP